MTEPENYGEPHPSDRLALREADKSSGTDRCGPSDDPIVQHLEACLHKERAQPDEMSQACADHVASALEAYLSQTSSTAAIAVSARGGLAPWQLRRAQEILGSRLEETVSAADLAREFDLSPGHFARAFKQTTGKPLHRWLLELRVEKAKEMLLSSARPLAEIAVACGFADQSHFTRVFSQIARSSPGLWRRVWWNGQPAPKRSQLGLDVSLARNTTQGEHSCQ
jgi:AraC family transcriptional regulator